MTILAGLHNWMISQDVCKTRICMKPGPGRGVFAFSSLTCVACFVWQLDVQMSCTLSDYLLQPAQDVVRVRLVDTHDHVLSTYDRQIAIYATEQFQRQGIELVMNCRVRPAFFLLPTPACLLLLMEACARDCPPLSAEHWYSLSALFLFVL